MKIPNGNGGPQCYRCYDAVAKSPKHHGRFSTGIRMHAACSKLLPTYMFEGNTAMFGLTEELGWRPKKLGLRTCEPRWNKWMEIPSWNF